MSSLLLLATEATAEGGGSPGATIAVVVLLLALAAFAVAYVVVGPGRRRGPKVRGDIPLAMRPYHSDEELETTGLERAMSWGVALAVFSALFVPLYWLIEPERIDEKIDEFYLRDVAFGRGLYAENCVTCHGPDAKGGSAPHPDPEVDAPWPAPALDNIVARYEDKSAIIPDIREFIEMTIAHGRPGTPMPAWGSAYNGPMNDQQIDALTNYILSIQTGELPEAQAFVGASGEDLFGDNCARCHGDRAQGYVGPQLLNIFERYGAADGDEAAVEEVREHIRYTILNGRNVPGTTPMPPFEGVLSDEAIQELIDYIESLQRTGGPRYGQIGGDPGSEPDAGGAATEDDTSDDDGGDA
ncbi:MAG: c-type cytochrome [Actinobacteria bacterium]|nr:c-type cytochrome [Actinomycetota bacterium]